MNDTEQREPAGRHRSGEAADGPGPGRRRRGPVLVGAGITLVAGVSVVGALGLGGGDGDDSAGPGRASQVVRVTRATLTEQTEIDGELGHGPEVPLQTKAKGTVTWLPEPGATLRRGGAVLRVDDRPVVLLYGSLPMYRELGLVEHQGDGAPAPGSGAKDTGTAGDGGSASGTGGNDTGTGGERTPGTGRPPTPLRGMDVRQFETNLSALGYTGFTVDDTYTELTAAAVRRWQKDLGVPQTGRVGTGDLVYVPGPIRIGRTGVRVGADAGGDLLSYTSTARMATVAARADDMGWARRGAEVAVDLPDGRSVKGRIASVGKEASAPAAGGADGQDGGAGTGGEPGAKAASVPVVITFADQHTLGELQSGPVTVHSVARRRQGVLTVPVAALVALAEGGHGLEPAQGGGTGAGRYIPVTTGLFADGKVEVSGAQVHEGMKVRIPE
ncbi:peptidoglycan-binding domain-containing protein [Streptomyces palmae]|uniref:peptidoglycan-binding domain-containing protein n=1 Tax=Streptomyces palmae TaxID=1701085 RepID=UPI001ADFC751|nr:peptidoglycan-binding domain-containing protein [Streptomyces palmae]